LKVEKELAEEVSSEDFIFCGSNVMPLQHWCPLLLYSLQLTVSIQPLLTAIMKYS
jgi:hypothetical protein